MSENDGINSKGRILRGDAIGQGRILAAVEGIARVLSPTNETIATISPMWANLVARFGVQGHATYFASGDSTLDSVFGMEIQGNAYKISSSLMEVTTTMDSEGIRIATSTATLPVVTTMDASGTKVLVSSADLLATFGFTSEGVYVGGGTATIDANTTLESDGTLTASGVATMAMIATLSAIPSGVVYQGGATLDVVSSLTATMWRLIRGQADPMNAEFGVTSSGNRVASAQGTLFGEFGLEVGVTNVFKFGDASLDAVTSIAIDATASYVSGSSLENAFHLASDAFLLFNGMATLSSTFELTSEAIRTATGDSTLEVIATLDSSAVKVANGDSTLDVAASLNSAASKVATGTSQLDMLATLNATGLRYPERGWRLHHVYPNSTMGTARYQIFDGVDWTDVVSSFNAAETTTWDVATTFYPFNTLAFLRGKTNSTNVDLRLTQPSSYLNWDSPTTVTTLNDITNGTQNFLFANDRWHYVAYSSESGRLQYIRKTSANASDTSVALRDTDATYDFLGLHSKIFKAPDDSLHIVGWHQKVSDNTYVLAHYYSTNNGTSWSESLDSESYHTPFDVASMGLNGSIITCARPTSSQETFDVITRTSSGTAAGRFLQDLGVNVTVKAAQISDTSDLVVVYAASDSYQMLRYNGTWSDTFIYDGTDGEVTDLTTFVLDPEDTLHWLSVNTVSNGGLWHHTFDGTTFNKTQLSPSSVYNPGSLGFYDYSKMLHLERYVKWESNATLPTEASLDATATYVTNADATLPVEATVEARGGFVIEGNPDPLNVEANVTAAGSRMILGTSAMEAYAGLTGSGIYVGKTLSTLTGEFGFSAEGEVVVSFPIPASGLVEWFDAGAPNMTSVYSNGNTCNTFYDSSGNGYDATRSGNTAIWYASGQNGQPYVRCDHTLSGTRGMNNNPVTWTTSRESSVSSGVSVFFVGRLKTGGHTGSITVNGSTANVWPEFKNGTSNYIYRHYYNRNYTQTQTYTYATTLYTTTTSGQNLNTDATFDAQRRIGGVTTATFNNVWTFGAPTGGQTNQPSGARTLSGESRWYELILYDRELDPTETTTVLDYLKDKYNLP